MYRNIRFDPSTGCWYWKKFLNQNNYGIVAINKSRYRVHRVMYTLLMRMKNNDDTWQISEGKFLCHTCNNPQCCNPLHVYEGNQRHNMKDVAFTDVKGCGSTKLYCYNGKYYTQYELYDIRINRDLTRLDIKRRMDNFNKRKTWTIHDILSKPKKTGNFEGKTLRYHYNNRINKELSFHSVEQRLIKYNKQYPAIFLTSYPKGMRIEKAWSEWVQGNKF